MLKAIFLPDRIGVDIAELLYTLVRKVCSVTGSTISLVHSRENRIQFGLISQTPLVRLQPLLLRFLVCFQNKKQQMLGSLPNEIMCNDEWKDTGWQFLIAPLRIGKCRTLGYRPGVFCTS